MHAPFRAERSPRDRRCAQPGAPGGDDAQPPVTAGKIPNREATRWEQIRSIRWQRRSARALTFADLALVLGFEQVGGVEVEGAGRLLVAAAELRVTAVAHGQVAETTVNEEVH